VNAKVIVVCDNPMHTGKIAKVSTFFVVDGTAQVRENGQLRRDRRYHKLKSDPLSPAAAEFFRQGETEVPACNLCGRRLPEDPRVDRAVEAIAKRGGAEQTVTLSDVATTILSLEA
jgi:hypothetical protein